MTSSHKCLTPLDLVAVSLGSGRAVCSTHLTKMYCIMLRGLYGTHCSIRKFPWLEEVNNLNISHAITYDPPGWRWTIIRWIWGWGKLKKGMSGTNCLFFCEASSFPRDAFNFSLLLPLALLSKFCLVHLSFTDVRSWFWRRIHFLSFLNASVPWNTKNIT